MTGFGKDNTGAIIKHFVTEQAVGTLAAATALKLTGVPVITEDFRVMKTELQAFVSNGAIGDTLFLLMANGELSLSEVADAIRTLGPIARDDRLRTENVFKNARIIGQAVVEIASGITPFKGEKNGNFIIDKFPWTYGKTNA